MNVAWPLATGGRSSGIVRLARRSSLVGFRTSLLHLTFFPSFKFQKQTVERRDAENNYEVSRQVCRPQVKPRANHEGMAQSFAADDRGLQHRFHRLDLQPGNGKGHVDLKQVAEYSQAGVKNNVSDFG